MRLRLVSFFVPVFLLACEGSKDTNRQNPPAALPAAEATPPSAPAIGVQGLNPAANELASHGGGTVVVQLPGETVPILYGGEEFAATAEVFKDFGPLTIDPAIVESGKAVVIKVPDAVLPWSGFWYPKRQTQLFEGDASPMRKLDDYLESAQLPGGAQDWEKTKYDGSAAEWEGLCDAWAIASVLTREPKTGFSENGIDMSRSDLKAIAIKYFEGYSSKIYGRRYLGGASTDGQIQDLRPEAFHKLVEEVIGKQQRALIIDEDPGPEIWSKPLFRMSYKYSQDPEHKNAIIVKAFPWMIRQRGLVDELPTSIDSDLSAPSYEYRLYYEPGTKPYKVVAGEWLGASINFHPDMVFIPSDTRNTKQYNPSVQKNNEVVRKLLVKVGMLSE